MVRHISKTQFLEFLHCPKNIWLKLHKPKLHEKFELSEFEKHIIEQGNEVESCARNLFPGGIEVVSREEDACRETVRLMASKVPTIFQSTFIVDGFIARNDMLSYDQKNDCWDLYEVKGTNRLKEGGPDHDHIDDIAFQASVLRRAKVRIGRYFLIHLNKDYIRSGNLDIHALFKIEDQSDKAHKRLVEIEGKMLTAREYLKQEIEPVGNCNCLYRSRRNHCTTFQHTNSHIPPYSIHDISYISAKKIEFLVENKIFDLDDITDDIELTDRQRNQITAHQGKKSIIDSPAIEEVLGALKFPLYFFDYEAYAPAIPMFNGYSPYKRIPFQFSLDILRGPDDKLEHVEFLHEELTDPTEKVAKILSGVILPGGSVISWHKSYEAGVNKEIATRLPAYAEVFERINSSLYDLKEIFSDQLYVHPDFKGKSSIKKVLPILTSKSYSEIDIREGGQAVDAWLTMVSPDTSPEEKKKINKNLKIYCGLDTHAMYYIWKHLHEMIE
ncbi:MAG: DUF2779 domain-containing protein [Patescibacteria group bacterium]